MTFLFFAAAAILMMMLMIGLMRNNETGTKENRADTLQDGDQHANTKRDRWWYPEEQTTEEFIYKREEASTKPETEEDVLTEEVFYEALRKMGQKILDKDLPYNGNAGHKTFEGAKDFNCALFVSWTLQDLGLLPSGKTFWFNDQGHGSGYEYMKKHKDRFRITHPNCPIRNSSRLKPGDICGMEINGYAPHTAVFAGRDKKGHMLWYSAGRTDFRKMAKKGFKPVRFRYYEQKNDILYTIVRIQYDEQKK